MAKLLEHFTERCLTYHAVFEGTGFFVAAKRTALATMFLMTGKRNKYYVHSTCDEVARAVPPEFRAELRAALGEFRSRGMLDYSLKSLRPPAGQDAEVR